MLAALSLLLAPAAAQPAKPNIVVIQADDLGFGDLSCYGATRIATPNCDRLAAGGRRFTSGYTTASTCTPTRFSLMTGAYAFRTPGTGIAPPNCPALIRPGTETLPAILKRAGYATAIVGKWHLGLGDTAPDWNGDLKPGPLDIGFDHALILPTTNDRVPQVLVEDRRVRNRDPKEPIWVGNAKPSADHPTGETDRTKLRMDWSHGHNQSVHNGIGRIGFTTGGTKARFRDEDLADTWVKESTAWIAANREKSFFLLMTPHDLHVPRMPHERFQGKSALGFRGDAILEFDWQVGEILAALDRLKLAENTLVILCSDNGPVLDDGYKDGAVEKNGDHKPAGPYRGTKGTVFEGGTRTPFIAYWKGTIVPGVCDEVVSTMDLAASFAALVGQPVAAGGARDSVDVSGVLLGTPGAKGRANLVTQNNGGNHLGFRSGSWKLVRQKAGPKAVPKELLFDLATDPGEATDVAAKHPKVVKRLAADLDAEVVKK